MKVNFSKTRAIIKLSIFYLFIVFNNQQLNAQVYLTILNKEIEKAHINILCDYTTHKKLVKLNDSSSISIDTSNLQSIEISHIGYTTIALKNVDFYYGNYKAALQKKMIQNEPVVVNNKKRKTLTFGNNKKKRLESGIAIDIGETDFGKMFFELQLPQNIHKIINLEFKAFGLRKGDSVLVTMYNTEIDVLNKNQLMEKTIIIKKDNDNIKLENIDKYEVDFPTTNFYCSFLVKNSFYAKHRTSIWARMKIDISNNFLYHEKQEIIKKYEYPYKFNSFQSDKNATNVHLAFKMVYLK
jgi:hypothetical protein